MMAPLAAAFMPLVPEASERRGVLSQTSTPDQTRHAHVMSSMNTTLPRSSEDASYDDAPDEFLASSSRGCASGHDDLHLLPGGVFEDACNTVQIAEYEIAAKSRNAERINGSTLAEDAACDVEFVVGSHLGEPATGERDGRSRRRSWCAISLANHVHTIPRRTGRFLTPLWAHIASKRSTRSCDTQLGVCTPFVTWVTGSLTGKPGQVLPCRAKHVCEASTRHRHVRGFHGEHGHAVRLVGILWIDARAREISSVSPTG